MKISDYIKKSIDDSEAGDLESSLFHVCAALDETARKEYPHLTKIGKRFKKFIQDNIDVIEVMFGGLDLHNTLFPFEDARGKSGIKFEDIIYEKFRCKLAHGAELENGFGVDIKIANGLNRYRFKIDIENKSMTMPESVIYSLGLACVLSKTNAGQHIGNMNYRYWDINNIYVVDEWWGRIGEARKIIPFDKVVKVKMDFGQIINA